MAYARSLSLQEDIATRNTYQRHREEKCVSTNLCEVNSVSSVLSIINLERAHVPSFYDGYSLRHPESYFSHLIHIWSLCATDTSPECTEKATTRYRHVTQLLVQRSHTSRRQPLLLSH